MIRVNGDSQAFVGFQKLVVEAYLGIFYADFITNSLSPGSVRVITMSLFIYKRKLEVLQVLLAQCLLLGMLFKTADYKNFLLSAFSALGVVEEVMI